MGIFPICPETYSHTLTESLSAGIPVIASNLGALEYRIKTEGGGWLIDINDPKKSYESILKIANDKKEYLKVKAEVDNIQIKSAKKMGQDYIDLYKKLLKTDEE